MEPWATACGPQALWASAEGTSTEKVLDFGSPADEERAAREGAAVFPLSGRTQIALVGADRTRFLHNLCTNDVNKLPPDSLCEAFLLNVKGHILWHAAVVGERDRLRVEVPAGCHEKLYAHLDRYHIREKVELIDETALFAEVRLVGPRAASRFAELGGPAWPEPKTRTVGTLCGADAELTSLPTGPIPEAVLRVPVESLNAVWRTLVEGGFVPAGETAWAPLRIEAGWPELGVDIVEGALPQEFRRDAAAISFNKGCYIGQETVARIDALGHVNKLLVGFRPQGAVSSPPAIGDWLVEEKLSGRITSAAWSFARNAFVGLGMARRGKHLPGSVGLCGGVEWETTEFEGRSVG